MMSGTGLSETLCDSLLPEDSSVTLMIFPRPSNFKKNKRFNVLLKTPFLQEYQNISNNAVSFLKSQIVGYLFHKGNAN